MSEISKFGRRYDREFKQKADALVLGGRRQGEVSRDLGVFRPRQPTSVPKPTSSASGGGGGRKMITCASSVNRAERDRLPQAARRVRAEARIKS